MIRTLVFAALALVGLTACSGKVVPISVTVLTNRCETQGRKATEGVDHYKLRITGPDIDPIERTYTSGAVSPLEQIPPGDGRQLTLYGYAGDPSSGNAVVKAWGQSLPFSVPVTTSGTVKVTVVLRPVGPYGSFGGVPTLADETKCATLTVPRAGHTATLLADGRVLIAGGFNLKNGQSASVAAGLNPANWQYLSSYEIFDPATNELKASTGNNSTILDATQPFEEHVAFHTATLLPSGKVLLYGGETSGYARPNGMLYDPSADTWSFQAVLTGSPDAGGNVPELPANTMLDRSHHVAVADNAGHVAFVGGVNYDSLGNTKLTDSVLWYDSATGTFHAVLDSPGGAPTSIPLAHLGASEVLGGGGIAIGGGDDLDGGVTDQVIQFLQFSSEASALAPAGGINTVSSGTDDPPRTHAALSVLGPEQRLMVLAGGIGTDGQLAPSTSIMDSTAINTHQSLPLSPDRARMDPCAAFLPDGRVIVAGGEQSGHVTSNHADLYVEDSYVGYPDGGSSASASTHPAGDMLTARTMHTCTVLKDGSVLIIGGVNESGGTLTVLNSIELYTPMPLN